MQNTTIKILTLFILTGIFNFETLGNNDFHLKGQLIEFKSQKAINGVVINCFSNDSLIHTSYTEENGLFEIIINTKIDRIELFYVGKLRLRIININQSNYETIDLGTIPLIETPFVLVNYEEKPSRKYSKQMRKEKQFITKGIIYENKCGDEFKIKFNRKREYYQYIDFKDLNCDN